MRESNTLYREHQRVLDVSRRLSEQNEYVLLLVRLFSLYSSPRSQLLELLHDLNQAPQVPPSHRYDLQPPSTVGRQPSYDQSELLHSDTNIPPTALHEARQGLKKGRISVAEYRHMEEMILQSKDFKPSKSYALLLDKSYASLDNVKSSNHDAEAVLNGFPTPWEEQRYLEGLDSYLNGTASTPRPFAPGAARGGERSGEKDKEMALKNPVSVYNWLRKHQPQVFLQDNEIHAEKPSRPAAARVSKRASAVKQEPELYDEDGIAIDVGSSSRGKRKRDDDGGYRPKGGNGRPMKRKKEDGSASAKKSKRASISGLT
jgi:hypothetical protein